jgi:hypothetical protein
VIAVGPFVLLYVRIQHRAAYRNQLLEPGGVGTRSECLYQRSRSRLYFYLSNPLYLNLILQSGVLRPQLGLELEGLWLPFAPETHTQSRTPCMVGVGLRILPSLGLLMWLSSIFGFGIHCRTSTSRHGRIC